jgi:hypothetical protein
MGSVGVGERVYDGSEKKTNPGLIISHCGLDGKLRACSV